jgi:hypothetical protein
MPILLTFLLAGASCNGRSTRPKTGSDQLYEYLRSRHAALASFYSAEHRYPDETEFTNLFEGLKYFAQANGLLVEQKVSADGYSIFVHPVKPNAPIETTWVLCPNGLWRGASRDRDAALESFAPMDDSAAQ